MIFTFIIFISTQNCFDRQKLREVNVMLKNSEREKIFLLRTLVFLCSFYQQIPAPLTTSWRVEKVQKKFLTITCGFCNAYNDNKLCCYEACSAFFLVRSFRFISPRKSKITRRTIHHFSLSFSPSSKKGWVTVVL